MKTILCSQCKNNDITWFAETKWNNNLQAQQIIKMGECWCNDCNEFVEPEDVALDKWIANGQS